MGKLTLTLVFIACIAYGHSLPYSLIGENARSAERIKQKLFPEIAEMSDAADIKGRGEKRSHICEPPHCQTHGSPPDWLTEKGEAIDAANAKRGADYDDLGNQ